MQSITPFLMFFGDAEAAMAFYTGLFSDATVLNVVHYGPEGPGAEGSVMQAAFTLAGQTFMCIDSNAADHGFTFTPAISFFVNCDTESEVERLFHALSDGGQIMMPLDRYPFSDLYGWVADRFGVSWQLNLAPV